MPLQHWKLTNKKSILTKCEMLSFCERCHIVDANRRHYDLNLFNQTVGRRCSVVEQPVEDLRSFVTTNEAPYAGKMVSTWQ